MTPDRMRLVEDASQALEGAMGEMPERRVPQQVGQHAGVHTEGYRRGGRRRKRELRAMRIINGPALDMQRETTRSRRRERRSA